MPYDEIEERILNAASRLLIRYGYDKTTLDDVAREAGLSRSTLYTRWKKKEILFRVLLWQEMLAYIDELMKRFETDLDAGTLIGFFRLAMDVLHDNAFMRTVYTGDRRIFGALLPENKAQLYTWRMTSTVSFLSLLQQVGMVRAEIDVQTLSYMLSSLQLGLLQMGEIIPHEQSPPMDQIMQATIDMLNAYAVPPNADREAGHAALTRYLQTLHDQLHTFSADTFSMKPDQDK
jgi:AcrR family transcriptional regulator